MRINFFFVALLVQGVTAHAQLSERTTIPAGDSISEYYSYLFPSFKEATVKFRDGRSFAYKMDFNMLLCDMQYIRATEDTLEITNPELIDSIRMDSCSFIFDYQKGYFQIVAMSDVASLAIGRRVSFQPVQKGGMGEAKQDGGVQMINKLNTIFGSRPMVSNQDIYAIRTTTYYLILKSGEMVTAGKNAFIKLYNGDKKTVEQYIKMNKINFNQQGDMEKIFNFCTQNKM